MRFKKLPAGTCMYDLHSILTYKVSYLITNNCNILKSFIVLNLKVYKNLIVNSCIFGT
jgi:hypothetical protein